MLAHLQGSVAIPQPVSTTGDNSGTVILYRGQTYYDALRVEEEGFLVAALQQRQKCRELEHGSGLYTTSNRDLAVFYSKLSAEEFSGQGGAGLITITLSQQAFDEIVATYGVLVDVPILTGTSDFKRFGVPEPYVETLFPYASLDALNASAQITVERVPLP